MSGEEPPSHAYTYHCICTTLILTSFRELSSLPQRTETADKALILPLKTLENESPSSIGAVATLQNVSPDRKPIVIRREDGFEKRDLLRCNRCELTVAYKLDEAHFGGSKTRSENIVYIMPGSLTTTEDMKAVFRPS